MPEEVEWLRSQLEKAQKNLQREAKNVQRARKKHADAARVVKGLNESIAWITGEPRPSPQPAKSRKQSRKSLADLIAKELRVRGPMTVNELAAVLATKGRKASNNSLSSALSREKGVLFERVEGTRTWQLIEQSGSRS